MQIGGYEPPTQPLCVVTNLDQTCPTSAVEFSSGDHVWRVAPGAADAALQANLRSQPSGVYQYVLREGVQTLSAPDANGILELTGSMLHARG